MIGYGDWWLWWICVNRESMYNKCNIAQHSLGFFYRKASITKNLFYNQHILVTTIAGFVKTNAYTHAHTSHGYKLNKTCFCYSCNIYFLKMQRNTEENSRFLYFRFLLTPDVFWPSSLLEVLLGEPNSGAILVAMTTVARGNPNVLPCAVLLLWCAAVPARLRLFPGDVFVAGHGTLGRIPSHTTPLGQEGARVALTVGWLSWEVIHGYWTAERDDIM